MNKRKITCQVIFDGVVKDTYIKMRRVYTDSQGEYIKSYSPSYREYYLVDDSYDMVFTTGRAISLSNLFKGKV
jgi:hypothetical protein